MLKNSVGSLVLVLGAAAYVCSCGSGGTTGATGGTTRVTGGTTGVTGGTTGTAGGTPAAGGTTAAAGGTLATGGNSAMGGASAEGGSATTGGAIPTGGDTAAGGTTGTSTMPLSEACAKNCALAYGLDNCSTTEAVCVQSCMTTFDNTSAVNPDLGHQYTLMMICVATDPYFATSSGFTCAKPDRALNKWSPVVDLPTDTPCNEQICSWNCNDGTLGNFDPWVDIPCHCSSVH
jgi:hypothetical protein